jgi:tagaturonate reductase
LPPGFVNWLKNENTFCNTLVDRIVTGYPTEEALALEKEWGYSDKLIVTGEPFAFWIIESKKPSMVARRFPLDRAGLPVRITKDLTPYRERKVRILNGTHTACALAAYLSGVDTVGEMMKDSLLRAYVERVMGDELSPMVPLPGDEVKAFANSVLERFENPFIRHNLLSIALNSVSKFRVRVLPTILETLARYGALPKLLCFSLAALIAFYRGGERYGTPYPVMDDDTVKKFFAVNRDMPARGLTEAFLGCVDFWRQDLTAVPGLTETVATFLEEIESAGMRAAVTGLLK